MAETTGRRLRQYLFRVATWDYHYGLRAVDPKRRVDSGCYCEIALLTFPGSLLRPENSKYRTAFVTLSGKAGMIEEPEGGKLEAIGSFQARGDEINAYIFVPFERLSQLNVAQSGAVQVLNVIGTKLRYGSGLIRSLSVDTQFDEEDW